MKRSPDLNNQINLRDSKVNQLHSSSMYLVNPLKVFLKYSHKYLRQFQGILPIPPPPISANKFHYCLQKITQFIIFFLSIVQFLRFFLLIFHLFIPTISI